MASRFWIGVVSREHVKRGIEGGYAQVGHGKATPLRRMRPGDWLIYYSHKMTYDGTEPCQAFTGIGEIVGDDPYQVEMPGGFTPFRRDVRYVPAVDAPIHPLLDELSFTAGKKNWGYLFRFGLFEIPDSDAQMIAKAMDATLSPAIGTPE